MICPNCGATRPDGSRFCTNCGAALAAGQPMQTAPVYSQTPPAKASQKIIPLITRILALICIPIIIFGSLSISDTSIDEIPLTERIHNNEMSKGFEDIQEWIDENTFILSKNFKENRELLKERLSTREYNLIKEFVEQAENCSEKLSLSNIRKIAPLLLELEGTDIDDWIGFYRTLEDYEIDRTLIRGLPGLLDFLTVIIPVIGIFFLAFSIFGGLFLSRALTIVGAILTSAFFLNLCGPLFFVLNLAVHAGMIVLLFLHHRKA